MWLDAARLPGSRLKNPDGKVAHYGKKIAA